MHSITSVPMNPINPIPPINPILPINPIPIIIYIPISPNHLTINHSPQKSTSTDIYIFPI